MAVFGIGIQMEKASIEFYRDAEQKTQIPSAKRLFSLLAIWEENHLKQFTEHYEDLKTEWWDKQDFQPY
jgi:rubrerythrin